MYLIKDIVIPLLVAGFSLAFISYVVLFVLRLFSINFGLFKFILVMFIWYFVGPVIYEILLNNVIINVNEIIKIIYMPIQSIINIFYKIV